MTKSRPGDDEGLSDALRQVQLAFGRYPYRRSMPFCGHCVAEGEIVRLGEAPLRCLPGGLVSRYAHKAVTTWGDIVDYKHFLPELIELMLVDPLQVSPRKVGTTLADANWRSWPRREAEAIEGFAVALWTSSLATPAMIAPNGPTPAPDALEFIEALGTDLSPYIGSLWPVDDENVLLHAIALVFSDPGWLRAQGWLKQPGFIIAVSRLRDDPRYSDHRWYFDAVLKIVTPSNPA